jgi:hypothetical protein
VRRLANQCFFDKLLISVEDEPEVAGATYREPWVTLLTSALVRQVTTRQHPTVILLVGV